MTGCAEEKQDFHKSTVNFSVNEVDGRKNIADSCTYLSLKATNSHWCKRGIID
jgi:hypothetical protein